MSTNNIEIRTKAKECGVKLWQIAEKLGMNDVNFSRKLRYELSAEDKETILNIIDDINNGVEGVSYSLKKSKQKRQSLTKHREGNPTLGKRIRECRKALSLTHKTLGERLNQNRAIISYYENAKRRPNIEILVELAEIFSVSTDYLLGLTDVKSTETDIKAMCDYTGLTEESLSFLSETTDKEIINFLFGTEKGQEYLYIFINAIKIQNQSRKE